MLDDFYDGYGWRVVAEDAIRLLREIEPTVVAVRDLDYRLHAGMTHDQCCVWLERVRQLLADVKTA